MEESLSDPPRAAASRSLVVPLIRKLGELTLSPVCTQVVWSLGVAGVGVALGIVLAFPAIALDAWTQRGDVHLTPYQQGWFASVVQLISIPGSVVGGWLLDVTGPRRLLLFLLPALAVSWVVLLFTTHHPILLIVVRALQGLLASGCTASVYVYPCEVSEAGRRGVLGALPEAAFSLGFLLTYLLGALTNVATFVLLALPCVFVPCIIAVVMVPESPSWLLQRGRLEETKAVLRRVRRPDCDIEDELVMMKTGRSDCQEESDGSKEFPRTLLTQPRYLLPMLTSITLVILKECTGQFVVVLFVVRIFRTVNATSSPLWSSVFVCCARVLANLTSLFFLGHFPRRTILSVSSVIAGLAMVLIASYFYTLESIFWPQWVPLVCLLVFVVAYGCGIGPVASLMCTELLPGAVRGLGSGLSTATLCIIQFSLTFAASYIDSRLHVCFWSYAAGCFILSGFTLLLPETRNRKLEQVEQLWVDVTHRATHSHWWTYRAFTPAEENNNNTSGHSGISDKIYVIV